MCLAKAYVRPVAASGTGPAGGGKDGEADDGRLVMENVTQVDVDGDRIRLRSLLGDTETLQGRVASIDFAAGRVVLQT